MADKGQADADEAGRLAADEQSALELSTSGSWRGGEIGLLPECC